MLNQHLTVNFISTITHIFVCTSTIKVCVEDLSQITTSVRVFFFYYMVVFKFKKSVAFNIQIFIYLFYYYCT